MSERLVISSTGGGGGTVRQVQIAIPVASTMTMPSTRARRFQFEMPRSSNIVRANEAASRCRFNVEKITHQPRARIQTAPPRDHPKIKVNNRLVNRMANCDFSSLKWMRVFRLTGA